MVKKASGSQSTETVSRQGQNKPVAGGTAGQGRASGKAKLPDTGLLSLQPGQRITGPKADIMMAAMQRQATRQKAAPRRK